MEQQLLNCGDIANLLGDGVILSAKFIEDSLGIAPTRRYKAAREYDQPAVASIMLKMAERCRVVYDMANEGNASKKPAAAKAPAPAAPVEDDDEL